MSPEMRGRFLRTLRNVLVIAFAILMPGAALMAVVVWLIYKGIRKLLEKDRPKDGAPGSSGRVSWDPDITGGGYRVDRTSWDPEEQENRKKSGGILEGIFVIVGTAAGLVVIKLAILGLMVIVIFFGLFTACADHPFHHSRREVVNYLKEEYPGEKIAIARKSYMETDEDGGETDTALWDCWFEDLPDAVFHAISYPHNGGPIPVWGYGLTDDAPKQVRNYYIEEYLDGGGTLDRWTWEYGFRTEFSSMEDMTEAVRELEAFFGWYQPQPHAEETSIQCVMNGTAYPTNVLRDRMGFFDQYSEDVWEEMEAYGEKMMLDYYTFYNIPSPEFTEEEIKQYAEDTWWCWNGLLYDSEGERVDETILDGIGLMPNGGTNLPYFYISYGGLYELLTRLGLEPEGTPSDFAVIGADGRTYAFSYEHPEMVDGEPCWQAVIDGEAETCTHFMNTDCAPVVQLSNEIFQTLTGLTAEAY